MANNFITVIEFGLGGVRTFHQNGNVAIVGRLEPGTRHFNYSVEHTGVETKITFEKPIPTRLRLRLRLPSAPISSKQRKPAKKGPRKTHLNCCIDGKKYGCYVKGCNFTAKCPRNFKRHFEGDSRQRARHPDQEIDVERIKKTHMTVAEAEKWVAGGKKGKKMEESEAEAEVDEDEDDEQMEESGDDWEDENE